MKRKIIFIMMLVVFINNTSIVSAAEIFNIPMKKEVLISNINISEEIDNALNGIIDELVPENIIKQVDVGVQIIPNDFDFSLDDNNVENVDIFDISYTVKDVGKVISENDTIGTMYALTAVAKEKESSTEKEVFGVECYITIVWIDNLGINNELVSVYGGWTANDRVLSERSVFYGVWETGDTTNKFPNKNTFSYSSNKTGLAFEAYSWVSVEDYPNKINCYVLTSIFD